MKERRKEGKRMEGRKEMRERKKYKLQGEVHCVAKSTVKGFNRGEISGSI